MITADLPPPERPVLEDTTDVWLSVVSAGFVLMFFGALSHSSPPPLYGAVVAALGVLWHSVAVLTGPVTPPPSTPLD